MTETHRVPRTMSDYRALPAGIRERIEGRVGPPRGAYPVHEGRFLASVAAAWPMLDRPPPKGESHGEKEEVEAPKGMLKRRRPRKRRVA